MLRSREQESGRISPSAVRDPGSGKGSAGFAPLQGADILSEPKAGTEEVAGAFQGGDGDD